MRYKLMMCGFSALCEDMDEVRYRLSLIPIERAKHETQPCYVIDLDSGKQWDIVVNNGVWEIVGL